MNKQIAARLAVAIPVFVIVPIVAGVGAQSFFQSVTAGVIAGLGTFLIFSVVFMLFAVREANIRYRQNPTVVDER